MQSLLAGNFRPGPAEIPERLCLYGQHRQGDWPCLYVWLQDHPPARDDVFFYNGALPAGSVIYKWDMVYSYSTAHAIPSLPLLINGRKYLFRLLAEADQEDGFYLRLVAFDREDRMVKLQIIRGQEGIFEFPKEANYYTIELVGAGCHQLVFHRIDVEEVTDETDISQIDWEKLHEENEHRRLLAAQVVDRYLRRRE